jgi:putative transcriptional regulator
MKKEMNRKIKRLYILRRRIKQSELARMTGIRPSTVNELYNEVAEKIKIEHIDRICEALDIKASDLIEYIPGKMKKTGKDLIVEEHGNQKNKKD